MNYEQARQRNRPRDASTWQAMVLRGRAGAGGHGWQSGEARRCSSQRTSRTTSALAGRRTCSPLSTPHQSSRRSEGSPR